MDTVQLTLKAKVSEIPAMTIMPAITIVVPEMATTYEIPATDRMKRFLETVTSAGGNVFIIYSTCLRSHHLPLRDGNPIQEAAYPLSIPLRASEWIVPYSLLTTYQRCDRVLLNVSPT